MPIRAIKSVFTAHPFSLALSLALSLVINAAAVNAVNARDLFNVQTATLDNGLQIAVLPDNRAERIRHMIWYRVGAADEPRGLSGMAHFLEHMMFKGTDAYPGDTFSRVVSRHGGYDNAFTSHDVTAYHQTVPSHLLGDVMRMEADRMRGLILDLNRLEEERAVVREERNMRIENRPFGKLREFMNASLYVHHPYGRPVIGWAHEVEALTADDLTKFYKQFYTPENAIVVIAGKTTLGEVLDIAETTYGTIAPTGFKAPTWTQDPPDAIARRVDHSAPDVAQETWIRMMKAPGSTQADRTTVAALSLLLDIVGGGASSRLYAKLVVEENLATSASSYYSSLRRDGGAISLYAAAREGVALEQIKTRIEEIVADVVANGVTQEELDRVRDAQLNSQVYLRDNIDSAARTVGQALIVGLTVDDLNGWPDDLRSVSVEDVNAVAEQVLSSPDHVTGYLTREIQS